jgi:hypothetical protein
MKYKLDCAFALIENKHHMARMIQNLCFMLLNFRILTASKIKKQKKTKSNLSKIRRPINKGKQLARELPVNYISSPYFFINTRFQLIRLL